MARFQLFNDSKGEFRFTLYADNGEPVATSEGYTTKQGAKRGIQAVIDCSASASINDITQAQNSLRALSIWPPSKTLLGPSLSDLQRFSK